jgi:glycosyltransferase involved in cell wall biosynthesis
MRVLQIITLCELGGAQSVVANIANALCENNEVVVASGEGDGKMWQMLDKRVTRVHLKHLKRELSLWSDLRTVFDMWRLYRKYKPDVIHLHSSKSGFLGRVAFPAKKVVYTVHGFDSVRVANRKFLILEKIMQWRCKSIVAVSKYDEYNLNLEKITRNVTTVYNGTVAPSVCKNLLFAVPVKYKKTVLCVARLSPQKNVQLFMDVAALLPEYAFVWIGNQNSLVGKTDNVFFLGNIPNAAMYSSIADLFVLTSNYEGLPIVILEAMSMGKPIVASAVGGVEELVQNDVNGYALENNAELFAEKISYVLENQQVYDRMSAKSKEIYEKDFTVDKMVGKYKEVYTKITGKKF